MTLRMINPQGPPINLNQLMIDAKRMEDALLEHDVVYRHEDGRLVAFCSYCDHTMPGHNKGCVITMILKNRKNPNWHKPAGDQPPEPGGG
jgi:hypothetical protein